MKHLSLFLLFGLSAGCSSDPGVDLAGPIQSNADAGAADADTAKNECEPGTHESYFYCRTRTCAQDGTWQPPALKPGAVCYERSLQECDAGLSCLAPGHIGHRFCQAATCSWGPCLCS